MGYRHIELFNIISICFVEVFVILFSCSAFVYGRFRLIKQMFETYLKDSLYSVTADEKFIEINIGDKFINKVGWENVAMIKEYYDYYLLSTSVNKRQFSFFPMDIDGAKELADFIKSKLKK